MESRNTELMTALSSLRDDIRTRQNANASDSVSLSQAFDRLVLGYQNGTYSEESVQDAISEMRSRLTAQSSQAISLRPLATSGRNEVLNRNYKALAERMLDQKRGTWDSRHLEIVQGAISHLSMNHAPETQALAQSLQDRMSDSVWAGSLELADTISDIQEESRALQQSLLDSLKVANTAEQTETLSIPENERIVAHEENVRNAVEQANIQSMRARMNNDYENLKNSKAYIEAMAQRVNAQKQLSAQNEETDRAQQSIREASRRLLQQNSVRVSSAIKSALSASSSELSPEKANELVAIAEKALNGNPSDQITAARIALNSLNQANPAVRNAARELDRIQWRNDVLNELASDPQNSNAAHNDVEEAQLLDARMMFEQKKLQFEQNSQYQAAETDLIKALDFEMPAPTFQPSPSYLNAQRNIVRINQVAQSAAAGDVGLYAPTAGSEYARNAKAALNQADQATPAAVSAIPTLHKEAAKRSNRLIRDVKQIAYHPSVRADMGFTAPRTQMDAESQQPLFKRVRFNRDNKQINELLPALYNISGVKMKKSSGSPLRKAFKDLNLQAANLELIKIIEDQFNPNTIGRMSDKISGIANEPGQRVDNAENPHARVANIISDWVDSRKNAYKFGADTQSVIKSGRMSAGNIESSLKSEGMQLPTSVMDKLTPFLGFDLSSVKIFTGPIAAMASEAMGAQAFTLGKNVFLGQNQLNFNTAEGLGLLAHEILHTSHFNAGDSVDSKEQAAEAMEARVKRAFGSGNDLSLALERDTDKKSSGKIDQRSSATGNIKPKSVGSRVTYDPEYIFESVCEKVIEILQNDLLLQKERNGNDN